MLELDFTTEAINEKWVVDITYIHTVQDGWCYLASVQDLRTIETAVMAEQPAPGLILHTDLQERIFAKSSSSVTSSFLTAEKVVRMITCALNHFT